MTSCVFLFSLLFYAVCKAFLFDNRKNKKTGRTAGIFTGRRVLFFD